MGKNVLVWIIIFCLTPGIAPAEYRVFLLKISKKSADAGAPPDFRQIASTLDPMQYKTYYSVGPDEEVTYDETWMCKGRTGSFQPLCPNPKGQIPIAESPTP